jgi:hypothetical protein
MGAFFFPGLFKDYLQNEVGLMADNRHELKVVTLEEQVQKDQHLLIEIARYI